MVAAVVAAYVTTFGVVVAVGGVVDIETAVAFYWQSS